MNVLVIVLQLVVLLVVVLLHVAYATYFERKVIGHMQMRMGPTRVGWLGLLQPIADGIKSFFKEDIIPSQADKPIFMLAPIICLVPAFASLAILPWAEGWALSNINIGLNEAQIPPAGNNIMRIRMPDVTKALDAALAEADATKRDARYQDVCKATNANLPWGTMWVANRYGVASAKLKNFVWTPAPAGGPYQAHPEKWSLAE